MQTCTSYCIDLKYLNLFNFPITFTLLKCHKPFSFTFLMISENKQTEKEVFVKAHHNYFGNCIPGVSLLLF